MSKCSQTDILHRKLFNVFKILKNYSKIKFDMFISLLLLNFINNKTMPIAISQINKLFNLKLSRFPCVEQDNILFILFKYKGS